MMFGLNDVAIPLAQAPMAGGVATPELVAATGAAGGLGSLAAGYIDAARLAEQIRQVRALSAAPFGVNVFVPSRFEWSADVRAYADRVAAEAGRYGVTSGEPDPADTHDWDAKLELLLDDPVPVVSFTFGVPPVETARRLRERGSRIVITVTSAEEARLAVTHGAEVLCVQGPEAGGHRGCFDQYATPDATPLLKLLREVGAVTDLPLIAAGGLSTRDVIAAALRTGASVAQLGTALLRTDEAGTAQPHRDALVDPRFDETVLTRAFSGRVARGLRNDFIDAHPDAPAGFPVIDQLTKPFRAAAASQGDAESLHLWAGTGYRHAKSGSAARIIKDLVPSNE